MTAREPDQLVARFDYDGGYVEAYRTQHGKQQVTLPHPSGRGPMLVEDAIEYVDAITAAIRWLGGVPVLAGEDELLCDATATAGVATVSCDLPGDHLVPHGLMHESSSPFSDRRLCWHLRDSGPMVTARTRENTLTILEQRRAAAGEARPS